MKECIEKMKFAVSQLKRGRATIGETEHDMDDAIALATFTIVDIDERIETIRTLKRKKYRMLLEATR